MRSFLLGEAGEFIEIEYYQEFGLEEMNFVFPPFLVNG